MTDNNDEPATPEEWMRQRIPRSDGEPAAADPATDPDQWMRTRPRRT